MLCGFASMRYRVTDWLVFCRLVDSLGYYCLVDRLERCCLVDWLGCWCLANPLETLYLVESLNCCIITFFVEYGVLIFFPSMEFPIELHGIPVNAMQFYRTLRMEAHEKFHGRSPWNSWNLGVLAMELHGIPWNIGILLHGIPWNSKELTNMTRSIV